MDQPRRCSTDHAAAPAAREMEAPFAGYLWSLRRGWRLCVVAAVVGSLLGWGVVALAPARYSARASIEIVGINESFLGIEEMTPTAPDSRLPQRTDMATRVRVLRSDSLRQSAIERLLSAVDVSADPQWERAVLQAAEGLEVTASDDSRIVDVSCQALDPRAAAGLANALAAEFVAHDRRTRLGQAEQTGEWMDAQLRVLASRAESSDARLQDYVRKSGLALTQPDAGDNSPDELAPLKQELLDARSDRIRMQAHAEMLERVDATALPTEETPSLRDQRAKLSAVLAERAELVAIYLPEHYKVQQLDAQITELRRAGEQERGRIVERFRSDYQAALRREKLLMDELERQEKQLQLRQEKEVAYRLIDREAAANRELYDAFLKQVKQAGLAAGVPAGAVRVLDVAAVPRRSLNPQPALGALAGLAAGLFFCGLFVITRDQLDRTFKRPGDAHRALNLRELGVVPDSDFEYAADTMTPAGFPAEEHPSAEKACSDARPSWLAECVRGVRTSLTLGAGVPKAIVVTSPTPGEGKTTVASNLAASLAESGRRVLLVDADLRRPRLHQVFERSNSQGLVDLLGDSALDPAEVYSEISKGFYLLPSGVASFGGPGLLHEGAAHALLERLRQDFDVLILDTPPTLAVSDARTLARIADGTILVVRAGETNPAEAIEAKHVLEQDGANLLGVVLNSWNPKTYGPRAYEKYGAMYGRPAAA